jgi:hypothetical protein
MIANNWGVYQRVFDYFSRTGTDRVSVRTLYTEAVAKKPAGKVPSWRAAWLKIASRSLAHWLVR